MSASASFAKANCTASMLVEAKILHHLKNFCTLDALLWMS
jgi:hypothetical protein